MVRVTVILLHRCLQLFTGAFVKEAACAQSRAAEAIGTSASRAASRTPAISTTRRVVVINERVSHRASVHHRLSRSSSLAARLSMARVPINQLAEARAVERRRAARARLATPWRAPLTDAARSARLSSDNISSIDGVHRFTFSLLLQQQEQPLLRASCSWPSLRPPAAAACPASVASAPARLGQPARQSAGSTASRP